MKKLIKYIFLFFLFLFLVGCSKKEVLQDPEVVEIVEDIEVNIDKDKINITHEPTEAEMIYQEKIAELNEYIYYYYSLESNSIKAKKSYMEDDINAQSLVNLILKQFTDKTILVENFELIKPNEVVSFDEHGQEIIAVEGTPIGYLTLDSSFQEVLDEQITPLMQWYIIQTLANTIINNLYVEKLQILSGGNTLNTLYKNYSLEDFCMFSTLAYDNLDLFTKDILEISKEIEFLIKNGYQITREQYQEIINTGLSMNILNIEPQQFGQEIEVFEDTMQSEEISEDIEESALEDTIDNTEIIEDNFSDEIDDEESIIVIN